MWVDCTVMLDSGGMISVATALSESGGSSSSGRRSFHRGSSRIRRLSSSYVRNWRWESSSESLMSFSGASPNWAASWSMLCHLPSLIVVRSLSILMLFDTFVGGPILA